jgi:tRNA nucleotidyltransferase (CCA-adding enzyme)
MIKNSNLGKQIKEQLPAELVEFTQSAGDTAARMGQKLYVVGGVVRDLLLERKNLDLDLVSEGDAIKLAQELAKLKRGRVIAHTRFNTAKIKWDKWSVDIATTRAESYEKSGSLPAVQCGGSIENDLVRRDFSINAMAVHLDPPRYGELIDLYRGREDLEKGHIRVLHDYSFRDDATRIWRAVRYEQRLDFKIERHTLDLLKRDVIYLDAISGDRIRHELELVLEEERPEKALLRADELGLLARMCPAMEANDWLAKLFVKARGMTQPYCPPAELYLAFLVYRLTPPALKDWMTYLKFPRIVAQTLLETLDLKKELSCLADPQMAPSRIYRCLHQYNQVAILANLMASGRPLVRRRVELYLNKLRHIQPALTGDELIDMGMAAGPRVKVALELLREARLDGKVSTREDELKLIKTADTANSQYRK